MKKLLLLCAGLALAAIGHTKLYPDKVGVCYKFDNDKLTSRGTCIITFRDGDGGYVNLDYQGKKYYYDVDVNKPNKSDYYRNLYYEKTDWNENISDELLRCHKDKSADICYL